LNGEQQAFFEARIQPVPRDADFDSNLFVEHFELAIALMNELLNGR
jgi:hypothetical protein